MTGKKIEIFCGTGGVGKTTLSASRALFLASQNKKVLLITIDPARRLKEILKLQEECAGTIEKISSRLFSGLVDGREFTFDALLMSPAQTLANMGEYNKTSEELDNPILNILTRPHGGMNEILAIVEVERQLAKQVYDHIILDTPPGKHFIDFLKGTEKIQQFFDKSFVDIFKYLGRPFDDGDKESKTRGILSLLAQTGIKKLLGLLEKVTGQKFVMTFIDAVVAIYNNKASFLQAISFQDQLKKQSFSNWFLVTSVEQQKTGEAEDLQQSARKLMHGDNYLAINKSLAPYLEQWDISEVECQRVRELKSSMQKREKRLHDYAGVHFDHIIEFPEILDISPEVHVVGLATRWRQMELEK